MSLPTPYYRDDAVTIYHGDCREIMPELPKVDLILTDPPYGLGAANTEKNNYLGFSDDEDLVLDLVRWVLKWGKEGGADRRIITPGQKMMFKYEEPSAVGVFYYPAGTGICSWGFVCWQPIFYYGKDPLLQDGKGRAANSFSSTESSKDIGHPCPKPIGQWSWLLNRSSRVGESVLDPFMGSGTTLRAAKDLGRKAIGIEIEEKYCEIAAKRMAQEVMF